MPVSPYPSQIRAGYVTAHTWRGPSRILYTVCRPLSGRRYEGQVVGINKDQVKGRVKEVEGKAMEVAGKLVGNEKLEERGRIQKTIGEAQAAVGDLRKDLADAVTKA